MTERTDFQVIGSSEAELREVAIRRLGKKRDFRAHLVVYLVINAMFWAIWYVTALASGTWYFPWPIFPALGWGVGVVLNFWDAYVRPDITEADVNREVERLRHP